MLPILLAALIVAPFAFLIYAKIYQNWDRDPDRGAIGIAKGAFGESYQTPKYLDQGWTANDSLWFYNTSQGSALMPYDMFLVLKEAGNSDKPFKSNETFDKYRYLPQKETFFNPDALPVGFTKTTYKGKDYVGYTCAACHTGQINYAGKAIRIDGGPAMADMVEFLTELQKALEDTGRNESKKASPRQRRASPDEPIRKRPGGPPGPREMDEQHLALQRHQPQRSQIRPRAARCVRPDLQPRRSIRDQQGSA